MRRMLRTGVIAEGPQIAIEMEANGFLYRMVRRIVGTLIPIGRGERSDEEFAAILQAADSNRAGPAVPPNGLCLTQVNY